MAVGVAPEAIFLQGSSATDRQGERWEFVATSINCEFVYADETGRINACTLSAWASFILSFCLGPCFTAQESH